MDHDFVVLGGGSAGYVAAIRAARLGLNVALIESDKVGGACLHRGCIPTKSLVHCAEVASLSKEASRFGVLSEFSGIDAQKIQSFKENVVQTKYKGLQSILNANKNITIYSGFGKLASQNSVSVDGQVITGKNILIATGAQSKHISGVQMSSRIIDSNAAINLSVLPEKIIVLGGGVIGVEFASIWSSFGAKVHILEAQSHLVPGEDEAVSKQLERCFRRKGIEIFLDCKPSIFETEDGVQVTFENGKMLEADLLLVAVGRTPATEGIGLEQVGIKTENGRVLVNENLESNIPGIYAAGDITPGLQLAHKGYQQGIYVAEKITGLKAFNTSDINIPRITYTDPEIASVGYTESKARQIFDDIKTCEYNLAGNAKSSILGTSGLVKVVQRKDKEIIGVHMIGSRVGELIAEAQLMVNWEAFPSDVSKIIHAHPTQSEAIAEAMMYLAGKPIHYVE